MGIIKQCSRCCKLEYKNKEVASQEIWNMPGSTDQDCGLTDRDAFLQNLIKDHHTIKSIKWLGFQI